MTFKRTIQSTLPEQDPIDWYKEQVRGITERIPGTMLTIRPAEAPHGVDFHIERDLSCYTPEGKLAQAGTYWHYRVVMEDLTMGYNVRTCKGCIPCPVYQKRQGWNQADLDRWVRETTQAIHNNRSYWKRFALRR